MDKIFVSKWKFAPGALIISGCLLLITGAAYSQTPGITSDSLKQGEAAKPASQSDEVKAALSKVQWTLSANREVASSVTSRKPSLSADRISEIVVLMAAIGRSEWKLKIDPDLITRSALGARSPKSTPAETTSATALAPPSASDGEDASPEQSIGRPVSPRLLGSVEMRDGRLVAILKNLDRKRTFSGSARVTITDGKRGTEMAPVAFDLRPNEEKLVPIDDPSTPYGDSLLIVYDRKQAVQLIRSLPFGIRPNTTNQPAANQPPAVEPKPAEEEEGFESIGEIEGAPAQKLRKSDTLP